MDDELASISEQITDLEEELADAYDDEAYSDEDLTNMEDELDDLYALFDQLSSDFAE